MKQVNMKRRCSTSYIGSVNTSCETDMIRVEEVRGIVKTMNKYLRESNAVDRRGNKLQYRVCLKGREAIKKKINRDDCPKQPNEERKKTYLQIIGSIIFGFTHCRLDLALPVGMLTRVMHSPSEAHLKQLYGLLKYLNATKIGD